MIRPLCLMFVVQKYLSSIRILLLERNATILVKDGPSFGLPLNLVIFSYCFLDHGDFISFLNECFLVIDTPKTWEEAEQECVAKKAHLVSIRDKTTQLYLMNETPMTDVWIGLSNKNVCNSLKLNFPASFIVNSFEN